jgi:diguanylate cyclase (GGDEF)-like protein
MRILIAEDDLTSRTMLAYVLKTMRHDIVETLNGTEAWQAMQEPEAPRLAILDWMMPEMDGLEVIRRVRSLKTNRPPYIIMLTAKDKKADIVEGLDTGADDYLIKPFDLGELRARVEVGRRMIELREELIASQEALAHQATHDPLTDLLNRRAILAELHKELARAGRHGDALAIGMIDIDHFKKINDTHGHQTGDDVLRQISRLLTESVREYDYIGRIGGEEFLVITPLKNETAPGSVFDRLRTNIGDNKMMTKSGELSVTVSIGVAYTNIPTMVDDILTEADAALYQAKATGRNRAVYATSHVEEGTVRCAP